MRRFRRMLRGDLSGKESMHVSKRLVLAYFASREQALEAVQILRKSAYNALLVERSVAGNKLSYSLGFTKLSMYALVGAISVGVVSYFAGFSAWFAASSLLGGLVLAYLIRAAQYARLTEAVTRRYGQTILANETLIAVLVSPERFLELSGALRSSDPPAIFVVPVGTWPRQVPEDTRDASRISDRLTQAEMALDDSEEALNAALSLEYSISPAAVWLLDNANLVRSEIGEVRRGLSKAMVAELPRKGLGIRIQQAAQRLIQATDAVISPENIEASLVEASVGQHLNIAEIWAFPQILRLVLICRLRGLSLEVAIGQQRQELAYFFAERIISANKREPEAVPGLLHQYLHQMGGEIMSFGLLANLLHDEDSCLGLLHQWLLSEHDHSVAEDLVLYHRLQAQQTISVSNIVGSLRRLPTVDFSRIFDRVSSVEALLNLDPSGVYGKCNSATKDAYRGAVERLARGTRVCDETAVAEATLKLAAEHPPGSVEANAGYYLLDDGRLALERAVVYRATWSERITRHVRKHPTRSYLSALALAGGTMLCAFFSLEMSVSAIESPVILLTFAVLLALPVSEMATQVAHAFIVSFLPATRLPRLSLNDGIPVEMTTLVAVPMMFQSEAAIERELRKLEVRYLANRETNLYYALVGDFTDAAQSSEALDKTLLDKAFAGVDDLNRRYDTRRFAVFHRRRLFSNSEDKWIGWERKRGKLEELNAWLTSASLPEHTLEIYGALPRPVRFVITVDADTVLPVGSAVALIATIAHPLNEAQIDAERMVTVRGFSIIQPRASIALPEAIATRFTRLFSDISGSDPYNRPVSDAYQDLFGHGIFHGKAIYNVAAFHRLAGGRFPVDTILSHDLLEGEHVRVGLASDIEVFESFPADYPSYCKRQHRWIRGDWQIAAWIRHEVPGPAGEVVGNPLASISRWKIFDNLRRSLVTPAAMMLVGMAWIFGTGTEVTLLVILSYLSTPFLISLFLHFPAGFQVEYASWKRLRIEVTRIFFNLILLPHQALICADAIIRSIHRRHMSKKRLLEWETAETTQADPALQINRSLAQGTFITAGATVLLIAVFATHRALWLAPILVLWLTTREAIRYLGQAGPVDSGWRLNHADHTFLRMMARSTWRFFDDLVGPDDHWLPPDNFQEAPDEQIAHRSSPTNIGLWMTSLLTASDMGYITHDTALQRMKSTLDTIARLEKFRGHLLNWYDTKSTAPLQPRYVSAADSGNFAATLITAGAGLNRLMHLPIVGPQSLRALDDHIHILRELSPGDSVSMGLLRALTRIVRAGLASRNYTTYWKIAKTPVAQLLESARWRVDADDRRGYWIAQIQAHTDSWNRECDQYLCWRELLLAPPDSFVAQIGKEAVALRKAAAATVPSIDELAGVSSALQALLALDSNEIPKQAHVWLKEIEAERARAHEAAVATKSLAVGCVAAIEKLFAETDFRCLYDAETKLLRIGLALDSVQQSDTHYDLLASEARLASLIGIAKGELPPEHWLALGRPYTSSDAQVLMSWGGTMFEYLMPLLFLRNVENSLLDNACRQAVRKQIEFGKKFAVPWGLSESGHAAVDSNQTYQYRAFGVPSLSLKPRVEQEVVVSPYSSALALQIDAPAAIANLRVLRERGLYGVMGFYEAIDYTREKGRGSGPGVTVQSYMAHHQAMTLLAINNLLHRGAVQNLFHSDLRIRSVETLLYERIPAEKSRLVLPQHERATLRVLLASPEPIERITRENTSVPRAHLLGNGRMATMLTNSGAGYTRWKSSDVTRWRADTTIDGDGSYCYVRNLRNGKLYSTTYQPLRSDDQSFSATFSADRVEYSRRDDDLEILTEVTVSPEDDAEIRRYSFTNRTLREMTLELTTYTELALAAHMADRTHPAFSKMFVVTEKLSDRSGLLASRRPRSAEDEGIFVAQILIPPDATEPVQFETDRASFLGREGRASLPAALSRPLNGSVGTVLDPVFAQRLRLVLKPRSKATVSCILVAAESREGVLQLVDKYRMASSPARAFELAWTHAQLQLRYLGIQSDTAQRFQELASHILYPNSRVRTSRERIQRNTLGQSGLWRHGISGDLPIVVITIADQLGLARLREILTAHTFWRLRGLKVDLVVLNQEVPAYDQPLANTILTMIAAQSILAGVEQPGGVYLRAWTGFDSNDVDLFLSAARVVIRAGGGLLIQQLGKALEPALQRADSYAPGPPQFHESLPLPFEELRYHNGRGGFTEDGREYAIYLGVGEHTPLPWSNVLANRNFGALVTEGGMGTCWSRNSQMNRLTPWQNDPVKCPASDRVYLRDEDSGEFWTMTGPGTDPRRVRHGQGYSIYENNTHGVEHRMEVWVPIEGNSLSSSRVSQIRLRNFGKTARRISLIWYVEWTLGTDREDTSPYIVTSWDEQSGAFMARSPFRPIQPSSLAYMLTSETPKGYTGDRAGFIGRNGSLDAPAAMRAIRLDRICGAGLDPCGALRFEISLDPGQTREVALALGDALDLEAVRAASSALRDGRGLAELNLQTRAFWTAHLGQLQVKTPAESIDFMCNGWLLYQLTACRLWGRTALYQSGGAFGFRDQLQDVMALCATAPEMARAQILLSASRQFPLGDAQHWWHQQSGAGIRTTCSDDYLWLVQATCHYVEVTGDRAILNEQISYLEGPLLKDGESESYFTPEASSYEETLLQHCRRALDHSARRGPHGLPLIGSGDWNDALNRVGIHGVGESVWMGWFLIDTLNKFAAMMPGEVQDTSVLAKALEDHAWDGNWYLRAFFDSGEPIGSHKNAEACLDSLTQSWAVISAAAPKARQRASMQAVLDRLVHDKERVIQLFDPPFDRTVPHPGYIMGYPPGLRENGGQYTHGALWTAMATARLGMRHQSVRLMQLLNPIESASTPERMARYKAEPYVVAADVYFAPGLEGRAGWTWYTGSAAWTYRVWIEEVLGFKVRGESCSINPVIPHEWPGFSMTYRHGASTYRFEITQIDGGTASCDLDGLPVELAAIPLARVGGERLVSIRLPRSPGGEELFKPTATQ